MGGSSLLAGPWGAQQLPSGWDPVRALLLVHWELMSSEVAVWGRTVHTAPKAEGVEPAERGGRSTPERGRGRGPHRGWTPHLPPSDPRGSSQSSSAFSAAEVSPWGPRVPSEGLCLDRLCSLPGACGVEPPRTVGTPACDLTTERRRGGPPASGSCAGRPSSDGVVPLVQDACLGKCPEVTHGLGTPLALRCPLVSNVALGPRPHCFRFRCRILRPISSASSETL